MSMMLTFCDAAWANARRLAVAGRKSAALAALAPLFGSPDAPKRLTLLAHRLAARLHFAAGRYRKSRRHLGIAASLDPAAAEIHFEIGQAFECDPYGCDRRAAARYKRAAEMAPKQARFVAAYGRALVRIDRVSRGVKLLREAARLAPTDAAVLRVVLDGLADAGRADEALATIARVRFQARTNAELRKLLADAKFRRACGPVRGPHPRPTLRLAAVGGASVRRDAGHRQPAGPLFARPGVSPRERG